MPESLKPMAITSLTRAELEQRIKLRFSTSEDVLGKLSLGSPENPPFPFKVRIYETSPKPSTEILLVPKTAKENLAQLISMIGIRREELYWVHPLAGGTLRRHVVDILHSNLERENPLIQIIIGPRQVGKTTAVQHLMKEWTNNTHYASADAIVDEYGPWLEKQWQFALAKGENTLLVLDEVQKVNNWAELVKKLWDSTKNQGLKVVLLGSTSLNHCLTKPLPESLAGRFTPTYVPHWSFAETQEAFGSNVNEYTIYGGYPKAMEFSNNQSDWQDYVGRSIINPIIDVDIFQQGKFRNIENLRRAFRVLCQEVSVDINYTDLLHRIQKAGNTDMIKRYLSGFSDAFLLTQVRHIDDSGSPDTRKNPRIMVNCPAIFTYGRDSSKSIDQDPIRFEQAVAGELSKMPHTSFGYWQASDEVGMDYFIKTWDQQIFGISIEGKKSKRSIERSNEQFRKTFHGARIASISPDNLPKFLNGQRAFLEMIAL